MYTPSDTRLEWPEKGLLFESDSNKCIFHSTCLGRGHYSSSILINVGEGGGGMWALFKSHLSPWPDMAMV